MATKLKPETALHIAFCKYLAFEYTGIKIHHSPNEGKRSFFQQYLIKAMNVGSGFPDLMLVYKGKCICIELKAEKILPSGKISRANRASENQIGWIEVLNSAGIFSGVCTGFDEAKAFADKYFLELKHIR